MEFIIKFLGIFPLIAPQSTLAQNYFQLESLGMNTVLLGSHDRDVIRLLDKLVSIRKSTHTNVEVGPGSFKQSEVNEKLPEEYLVRQFKKLLAKKKQMENEN